MQVYDIYNLEKKKILIDYFLPKIIIDDKEKEDYYININYSHNSHDRIKNLILSKEERTLNIVLIMSYKCNMICQYCYEDEKLRKKNTISTNKINLILDKIKKYCIDRKCNKIELTLLGGEPLLDENYEFLKKFFTEFNKKIENINFEIGVITNGLIGKKIKNYIKEFSIKKIQITLDGLETIHNKRRMSKDKNMNSFEKVIETIKYSLKEQIYVDIRVNIDEENIKEMKSFYMWIKKTFLVEKKCNLYFTPVLYNKDGKNELKKNETEIFLEVLEEFKGLNKKEKLAINFDFKGALFVRQLLNKELPIPKNSFCALSKGQLVFDNFGKIYDCWYGVGINQFEIGNLNHKEFDEIKINSHINLTVENIEKCSKCKYKYLCGSGCKFKSFLEKKSNYYCSDFYNNIKAYLKWYYDEI